MAATLLLFGNQLFPARVLRPLRARMKVDRVLMVEDEGICRRQRRHQHKLVLVLAGMRAHARALGRAGFEVRYRELAPRGTLWREVDDALARGDLVHFEHEDARVEARIAARAEARGRIVGVVPSPAFLCPRTTFDAYVDSTRSPRLIDFYRRERRRLGVLVDARGAPAGGRWSFDADNRRRLPAEVALPALPAPRPDPIVAAVQRCVRTRFADHPGDAEAFWLPHTRAGALRWLDRFVTERLADFGPYEDAMTSRSPTVFHSVLSPLLNVGLLTPDEVLARVLAAEGVPLASREGFVRQLIGWREFVRGIHRRFGAAERASNHFGHRRRLTPSWWEGTTGIAPLDHVVRGARTRGYSHHIERLMVVANLMTLAEIRPDAAYRWFMSMYVDAYDWVMVPNVYGMGLFADGGLFATKPYVCGSNYLLKMSDFPRGPWCDVVDGLYWRFVDMQRDTVFANARLRPIVGNLERMATARRSRLFAAAEEFLTTHTTEDTEH